MDGSLIDATSQIAVVEVGENGLLCGIDNDDSVWRLGTPALRVLPALCDISVAESGEFLFAVDPDDCVVGSLLELCAPLLLQVGDALVDLFDTGFLFF